MPLHAMRRRSPAVLCGLLLAAASALAAPPATAPSTLPVPDAVAARAAMLQVQELRALRKLDARGLLRLSLDTTSSPALRHAAALHAMETAADAGQTAVALEALRELTTRFAADELALGITLAGRLQKSRHNEHAAVLGCRYLAQALATGKLGAAEELVAILHTVRPALQEATAALCAAAVDDYQHARQLAPGGPVYACLYLNRWDTHLEALSRGDGDLARLARADLAAKDTPARIQAADDWWAAAQSAGGQPGWRVARRACALYAAALPHVDGVQQALLNARIAEHQRQAMVYAGMLPGVIRETWKDGAPKRERHQVPSPSLPRDAVLATLPKSQAHARFVGQILVDQPGRYELICLAGSGLRVQIDALPRIDNPKAYAKRNGEKLALDLTAGLHPIDIEIWSASSQPRLELRWKTPTAATEQPLPDSVFYHDPLSQ